MNLTDIKDGWDNMVDNNPKIVKLKNQNGARNTYSMNTLINSPVSIYCMVWTIKNLIMHFSSCAVSGDDVTGDLKKYYYANPSDKELMDYNLTHLVHELMQNSLIEMTSYPDISFDNLIQDTMDRYNTSR